MGCVRHNIKSGNVADKKVKLAAVENCTGLRKNNGRRATCQQLTCNNYHTKKPTTTKLAEIFLHSFPNHRGTYIVGPDIEKTPNVDRRLTIKRDGLSITRGVEFLVKCPEY